MPRWNLIKNAQLFTFSLGSLVSSALFWLDFNLTLRTVIRLVMLSSSSICTWNYSKTFLKVKAMLFWQGFTFSLSASTMLPRDLTVSMMAVMLVVLSVSSVCMSTLSSFSSSTFFLILPSSSWLSARSVFSRELQILLINSSFTSAIIFLTQCSAVQWSLETLETFTFAWLNLFFKRIMGRNGYILLLVPENLSILDLGNEWNKGQLTLTLTYPLLLLKLWGGGVWTTV